MNELRERLDRLPSDEREEALAYYEEYFDEAGVDHEQDVIRELGSPTSVASRIYADRAVKAAGRLPIIRERTVRDLVHPAGDFRGPWHCRDLPVLSEWLSPYSLQYSESASRRLRFSSEPRHLYKRFRRPFLHARDGTGHVRCGIHFVGDRENHICDHGRGAFSYESVYLLAL